MSKYRSSLSEALSGVVLLFTWNFLPFTIVSSQGQVLRENLLNECPSRCSCFTDTLRCKSKELAFNSTTVIPRGIRTLDLRFSDISDIPPDTFSAQFDEAQTLLLNNNEIGSLRNGAFRGLRNIRYLYLYKNQITSIEAHVFADTPNLEHLYMHYNAIKKLPAGLFSPLARMQRLFLHHNAIQKVPEDAFPAVSSIRRLRLDGNPLTCDCDMKWIMRILSTPGSGGMVISGTCAGPPGLNGWDIYSVTVDRLDCAVEPTRAPSQDDFLVWSEKPLSQTIPVSAADAVEFRCSAVGNPEPTITWVRDGLQLGNFSRVSVLNNGKTLRIAEPRVSDKGRYECNVKNAVGNLTASAMLHAPNDVKSPRFLERPPFKLSVKTGENFTLFCHVDGNPIPTVQWSKDDEGVRESHRIRLNGQALTVLDVSPQDDSGVYECLALNDVGHTGSRTVVDILPTEDPIDGSLGTPSGNNTNSSSTTQLSETRRRYIADSVLAARESIESAVEDTVMRILRQQHSGEGHPSSLLQVFKNRNSTARQLATAGEVFERTLAIINRHVRAGHKFDAKQFSYKDVLNSYELNLISTLSGCNAHRDSVSCSDLSYHGRFRSIEGTCNNLRNPFWGASLTGFNRLLKPVYENGLNTPVGWSPGKLYHGYPKPSPRLISRTVISSRFVQPDDLNSHMVMQWGQFLDHDLDHAIPSLATASFSTGVPCNSTCLNDPPCFPITVPAGDARIRNRGCMEFTRSSSVCGSGATSIFMNTVTPREQINQVTAFIDASQVYGSTEGESRILRNLTGHGYLRVGPPGPTGKGLLPFNENNLPIDCRRDPSRDESEFQCFLAGDVRVNEQLALTAMHTLWVREHNRVAAGIREVIPGLSGEELFQEARKIVGAEMQVITFKHWLPRILGPEVMKQIDNYPGYNESVDPSIANVFATAAFRFGHALVNPILLRLNEEFSPIQAGHLPLHLAFFSPWRLLNETGIDPLLRGLMVSPAKSRKPVDEFMNVDLTERLFEGAHRIPLDLAAINIQRGRDHALPGYGAWRVFCGFKEPRSFEELRDVITSDRLRWKLQSLYGHPGNMDAWVGFLAEDPLPDSVLGPTVSCVVADQFKRLQIGDRFWYQRPGVFSPRQLEEIEKTTLGRVICDNGDDIKVTTPDVFTVPARQTPHFVSCDALPAIDFSAWRPVTYS